MATTGGANNPSAPQSWNRYTYVTGDPINLIDPHGQFGCDPITCWEQGGPGDPGGGGGGGGCTETAGGMRANACGGDPDPGSGGQDYNLDLLRDIQPELDKLLANPDCAGIFGNAPGLLFGTSSTPTVTNVLDSLINGSLSGTGSQYGIIKLVDPTDSGLPVSVRASLGANAAVTVADSPFWHSLSFASTSSVYVSNLDIGDNFNTSANNAELTILHELGHVLSNLNWKGDQIRVDANNLTQSTANDSLIKSKCGLH